ncbi:predicted protein [Methanosarcina acetivorans C2A]|uniref:Uncharacterized protein n=1 Tax=Methanosarcina acetivorans (strain ATCC 35395 / DSM 2834 / JCM 12185 / C2A) TaxID=188937 RepID=Q8TM61_METAC|nr:predicted protein [Methanosarcina acetivorans C2A]
MNFSGFFLSSLFGLLVDSTKTCTISVHNFLSISPVTVFSRRKFTSGSTGKSNIFLTKCYLFPSLFGFCTTVQILVVLRAQFLCITFFSSLPVVFYHFSNFWHGVKVFRSKNKYFAFTASVFNLIQFNSCVKVFYF